MMIQAKRATIRGLLVNNYTDILIKARKGCKGLRMQYISSLMIVGEYSEGLRCVDFSALTGKSLHNGYQVLLRGIKAGYIRKENKKYYLTDKGANVYATICREFDVSLKKIVEILAAEVRNKI